MATPLSADRLLTALRNEGLRVVEYRDWRTNSRNHKGPWGPVNGVMIHHTVTEGTMSSVELCYNGHSNLPGPLCHGVIAKDGTVYLVGNGRANHAGLGDADVLRAVINEQPLPPDNEANTDGNRHFYGFECVNLGDGKDPWPAAQLEAIERVSAAICRAHGWGYRSVIRHLDWQPGKVDPRGVDWAAMHARIAARLGGTPTPIPSEEDDDMTPAQARQLEELHKAFIPYMGWQYDGHGKGEQSADAWRLLNVAVAQGAALNAAVAKLAEGGGLSAAEIEAAAAAGARTALAELGKELTD